MHGIKNFYFIAVSFIIIIFCVGGLLLINQLFLNFNYSDSGVECSETESGWECSYPGADKIKAVEKIKKRCLDQGGRWEYYIYHHSFTCDLPYEDGGNECFNSSQCQDICLITEKKVRETCSNFSGPGDFYDYYDYKDQAYHFTCNQEIKGKCNLIKKYDCDPRWYELNDGVIKAGGGAWCS